MKAFVKRDLGGRLCAADRPSDEALRKLKAGQVFQVEVKRPRNIGHHRKWWALCSLIAENMDGDVSAETVSDVLKIRAGHVKVVRTKGGEVFLPDSISFAAMDQGAFEQFWERAVAVVARDVIPGINRADLEREVQEMIA